MADIPADMQAELENFDAEAQGIIAAFVGPLNSQLPLPIIYHYTNFKGILQSGALWVTDAFLRFHSNRLS